MDITTLTTQDICRHEYKCAGDEWMCVTVPDYKTYKEAVRWLQDERKYELISVSSVFARDKHTGAFTFKFLCKKEYMWFKLRWG